jgi:alkaline phosphatase D
MAEEDIAFVVHLGDYLYEYGIDEHGGNRGVPVPDQFRSETETLERYRLQHALYKSDPDLQRAHGLFPWFVTWDDHEVENDYAGLAPEGGEPNPEFTARRAASYQAFYEHIPLRPEAFPRNGAVRLHRRVDWGDLARFNVVDERQYRTDQPCGDGEFPRQRIIDHLDEALVRNPVLITGDCHSTFVNDIKADFSDPASKTVATGFVGTSISSNSDFPVYGPTTAR